MNETSIETLRPIFLDPNIKFIARLGGSDYDLCVTYLNDYKEMLKNFDKHYHSATNFNGYFDKSSDRSAKIKNFVEYIQVLIKCYKNAEAYTVAGHDRTGSGKMMCDVIDSRSYGGQSNMLSEIGIEKKFKISYLIIESMMFLPLFDHYANKRILFISPFSESVRYQYTRKEKLFKNYVYPNFELLTYTTPVTYNNESDNLDNYSVKENWLEQSKSMADDISKLHFDIAFLSCGSYAMFLGDYIAHTLNRKAIYLGGVLNMYFNIYGARYDRTDKYFERVINIDSQIKALETNKFSNIKGGRTANGDSLLAYL